MSTSQPSKSHARVPRIRIRGLRPRIYVSGPISHGNPQANCQRAIQCGFELMDLGYAPFIPHLSFYSDPDSTFGQGRYEQTIELDLSFISVSHAVVRLPGFSPGADREIAFARSLNIPVFDSIEPFRDPTVRKRLLRQRIAHTWYERNKERNRVYSRRTHYKRVYGISIEQYQVLLKAQGGVCAICRQPQQKNRLAIDHQHGTTVIRGLLCVSCNGKLGWLEQADWDVWIKNATSYLQGSAEVPPAIH